MSRLIIMMLVILTFITGCGSGDSSSHSALCVDGTYSDSQSCSGTCSGHGGVSQWMGVLSGCGGK
jgi:major membrane immunogen (membrane-anchored lipoprotein)